MTNNIMRCFHWVLKLQKRVKPKLLVILVLSVLFVMVSLSEVLFFQYIVDNLMIADYSKTIFFVLLLILALVGKELFNSLIEIAGQKLIQFPIISSLSNKLFRNMYTNSANYKQAVYIDMLTQDVQDIGAGINSKIRNIRYAIQAIAIMVLLFNISTLILYITAALVLIYVIAGHVFTKIFIKAREAYMQDVSLIHQVTEEGISSSREVLAYNKAKWEEDRRIKVFDKYYVKAKRLYFMGNLQYFATNVSKWAIILFILFYGGYLVINNSMSLAVYVAAYRFCTLLIENVEIVYSEFTEISGIIAKVNRIKGFLDNTCPPTGNTSVDRVESIEFCNVGFSYDGQVDEAVSDLSFKIDRHRKIALVGPSGSGKSTIIKLLLSIIKPTKGMIKINGIDLNQIDEKEWLGEKAAACFQEAFFFDETIENNIKLGHEVSDLKLFDICKKLEISGYILNQKGELQARISDRGINLSGGERQRLALARLFTKNVKLYLLDEPTSAVDILTEDILKHSINQLVSDNDGMMFISAHRLSTVNDADVIIVMNNGRLTEMGTHQKLQEQNGLYRHMLDEQNQAVHT